MPPEDRLARIEAILDRLVDRHEALAQTVQILTADIQLDSENIRALARNSVILHDSIKSLERIAISHEQRLDHPENQ